MSRLETLEWQSHPTNGNGRLTSSAKATTLRLLSGKIGDPPTKKKKKNIQKLAMPRPSIVFGAQNFWGRVPEGACNATPRNLLICCIHAAQSGFQVSWPRIREFATWPRSSGSPPVFLPLAATAANGAGPTLSASQKITGSLG